MSNARVDRGKNISVLARYSGLALALMLGMFTDCGGGGAVGGLYVTVTNGSSAIVSDAVVTTMPKTESLVTDALGSVLFARVPAGIYAVTAVHPTAGAGRVPIMVVPGSLTQVTIALDASAGPSSGTPTVRIVSPASGTTVIRGTAVFFQGTVMDDSDAATSLAVRWESSLDGLLSTQLARADGGVTAVAGGLSSGFHLITLKATDSKGLTGSSSITLTVAGTSVDAGSGGRVGGSGGSGAAGSGGRDGGLPDATPAGSITLNALAKDSNGVGLSWTATPSLFASYRVYRGLMTGAFSVINVLQDPTLAQYRDESGQLGTTYSYRIGGLTAGGQEILSNTQMVTTGLFISVGSQVETMMVDRTRPYIYALDRVNNSLHFINLTTNSVEKTIFVGSTPVDMDINKQGNKLYIANFGSTQITIVDLDTRAMSGSLFVDTTVGTWDGNPYRITCTAGDTLVFTSMDQWNNLKLVNAITGASLDAQASVYEPDLVSTPDGSSIFVGEFGISTTALTRWDIVANKLQQVDASGDNSSSSSRLVLISDDSMYIYYGGKKYLARNLKSQLGTFSEPILVINADGTLAIGAQNMFDGTTFAVKRPTPLQTSTMALSADGSTLYLYDSMSSNIYYYKVK